VTRSWAGNLGTAGSGRIDNFALKISTIDATTAVKVAPNTHRLQWDSGVRSEGE
jgi:hypothetical protein